MLYEKAIIKSIYELNKVTKDGQAYTQTFLQLEDKTSNGKSILVEYQFSKSLLEKNKNIVSLYRDLIDSSCFIPVYKMVDPKVVNGVLYKNESNYIAGEPLVFENDKV
jgi:hypothetical protein